MRERPSMETVLRILSSADANEVLRAVKLVIK
jgi:hypothetical protein